ncbi:hypothetical protein PAAG_02541 [Paracoccidioides lutzii Pb01]|uniref:Peptidoglycan recognition protein family domain-containing protein n=1 Tax=Paracoccidioides lutzii (strain ATCC MYA-826 / Pb01) TaxID=502779 RepID=C1GV68_PARBA|nr:hypothetical protein PAAG_02541 [Paracoccidioides lutzii Pb01]EEH40486.2 hypothetical protein PAAG_02541 [Paracoccidioides lutzii Pb01]
MKFDSALPGRLLEGESSEMPLGNDSPTENLKLSNSLAENSGGAKLAKSSMSPVGNPKGVKIHCTGGYISKGSHSKCARKMRAIQTQHRNDKANGWGDIAYTLAVCQHGYVFEDRGSKYQITRSVLALAGSAGDTTPSKEMIQGINDAVTYLRSKGVGKEVKGHRHGWATSCPGGPLYKLLKEGKLNPSGGGGGGGGGRTPKPPETKYSKFPAASWFHRKPRSSIVTVMGKRLVAEGCSAYKEGPGPQCTDADRASYKKWQQKLGFTGKVADGWPGKTSWTKLKVRK